MNDSQERTKKLFQELENLLLDLIKNEETEQLDRTIVWLYNHSLAAFEAAKKAGLTLPSTVAARIF